MGKRRYADIKRGGELKKGLENLIAYQTESLNNPQTVRGGNITGKTITSRPRTRVAVLPFGVDTESSARYIVQASKESIEKAGNTLGSRLTTNLANVTNVEKRRGFVPAKIHFFEPDSSSGSGASYKRSEKTGLYYINRDGKSYTVPFGATSESEEFATASAQVIAAIEKLLQNKDYVRVWVSNEKI